MSTGLALFGVLGSACDGTVGMSGSGVPAILSVFPEEGADGVSVLTDLEIRFSTDVNPSSVEAAVSLQAGEREVRSRKTLRDLRTLLIEPTDPLDFGTAYQVVVEPSLRSRSGKAFPQQESWGFFTEGDPLPPPEADSLRFTLEALAHDSMSGRGSGTEDEAKAALFLRSRFESNGLIPAPVGWFQDFEARSRRTDSLLSSQNVLAAVPGSGLLASEWVIVGAHYDHIGLREQADGTLGINNGADDNGSGTVLLLEVARVLQAHVASDGTAGLARRSVLFVAFGSEEEGLLGSCHYAGLAPAVPIHMTRAMINFDMVGRLRDGVLQVGGLETSGDWANMVVNSNAPELVLYEPPPCGRCSDFACFGDRGVPYLWFFTGIHEQYHSPADDVETINFQGLVAVGEVALRVLTRLTVAPLGPAPGIGGSFQGGSAGALLPDFGSRPWVGLEFGDPFRGYRPVR